MPTWSGILGEIERTHKKGEPPKFDEIRRKYLVETMKYTKRNIILYASNFTSNDPTIPPESIIVSDEDLQALMEVIHGLEGSNLDLILHSPGGSLEAAEAFVLYLRSKFNNIRVIVPQLAMSAATMIACAADVIVMGKHSFLGPIDPQLIMNTPLGIRSVPAQGIIDQFEKAKKECEDPSKMASWLPMLNQYGPDLLVECENVLNLSSELVENWLKSYMFKELLDRDDRAHRIASWLSNHSKFKTHGRHIPRHDLLSKGLIIKSLEDDQYEQDLFLSIFHATTHTFIGTSTAKILENHLGKAYIKRRLIQIVQPAESEQKKSQDKNLAYKGDKIKRKIY